MVTADPAPLPQLDLAGARSRLLDDDEILRAFLAALAPALDPGCEKLALALASGRLDHAKLHAHSLRGLLAGAGAEQLVQRLRDFETGLPAVTPETSAARLADIRRECAEIGRLIGRYLDTPTPA